MTLSDKKVLVYDRGLYPFLAEKFAEKCKVDYFIPESDPYPTSTKSQIGEGLSEIKCIDSFWQSIDNADMIFFPDCYDGDLQNWLRKKGYRVYGSGQSEIIELDKWKFIKVLKAVGLPCPNTELIVGLDALEKHLSGIKEEKWLKSRYCRGDFDTKKYRGMDHIHSWLDDLRCRLGRFANSAEVLVQDAIESTCEAGYDGYNLDGECSDNCLVGYEIKDAAYLGKVFEETPLKLKAVNYKMSPVFKKLGGYRGQYSTEVRIDKKGKPYFIDPTCRSASPPTELMSEMLENYAEAAWDISDGKMPKLKWKAKYGAQIVLVSEWHDKHELHVEFPENIRPFVKLKNHAMKDGKYYCIPNGNQGCFGSVIAYADTSEEAIKLCLERYDQINCEELDRDRAVFDEAREQVKSGEEWGIKWD